MPTATSTMKHWKIILQQTDRACVTEERSSTLKTLMRTTTSTPPSSCREEAMSFGSDSMTLIQKECSGKTSFTEELLSQSSQIEKESVLCPLV